MKKDIEKFVFECSNYQQVKVNIKGRAVYPKTLRFPLGYGKISIWTLKFVFSIPRYILTQYGLLWIE